MKKANIPPIHVLLRLLVPAGTALLLAGLLFMQLGKASLKVNAAPIDPPEGYAKFNASAKVVTPTLAHTGATLTYVIEVRNTGAYASGNVSMVDVLPSVAGYNGDVQASAGTPGYDPGTRTLSWNGTVGFDTTVLITYSVDVDPAFSGTLANSAVISHPATSETITVTAEAVISDDPILTITKHSTPAIPGPNKELTYWLEVTNEGQPAVGLDIVVNDTLPQSTQYNSVGDDGTFTNGTFTFNRTVNLDTGATSVFTFSVDVTNVPSGTVITNDAYSVAYLSDELGVGEPVTTTVLNPILLIAKHIYPDPPGSNGNMTYTITVVNLGSLATDLLVTDVVPGNVEYVPSSGGTYNSGTRTVSWDIPVLDTDEVVQVSYEVVIGDIAQVPVVNATYSACSSEGTCAIGDVLNSTVFGPSFEVWGWVDPLAKKPGGGKVVVTPTLMVENLGPGSALDATALLTFRRISVSNKDVLVTDPPGRGTFFYGPDCGDKCNQYIWVGDIAAYETITFTTNLGQSSIGGAEGTTYTATLVITDQLGTFVTEPITGSAIGKVTHFSNLIPIKTAPPVIGAGEVLTYVIDVFNSGQTTDLPPNPVLTETIPLSTTFVNANGDPSGDPLYDPTVTTAGGETTISWKLPSMGPGAHALRSFSVLVPDDMVTGTQIINDRYGTIWTEGGITETTVAGVPVTTTVREVGLIDSYKEVFPQIAVPGPNNVLTYTIHVVNSGPHNLTGVNVYDQLPWQSSTYQRDAVASSGVIDDDIVSVLWTGDVAPFSEETITLTVLVDEDFSGAITNTAVITHPLLRAPVEIDATAYITDEPVLKITKTASPDPVYVGDVLVYTIQVTNMGQRATQLVITDTVPEKTQYVQGSVSAGGTESNGELSWEVLFLQPGESVKVTFRVVVGRAKEIINTSYRVSCFEGASAVGLPVVTKVVDGGDFIYLPLLMR